MRRPADYSPLIAALLAAMCGMNTPIKLSALVECSGVPYRHVQYALRRMESQGVVERPDGPRKGWRLRPEQMPTGAPVRSYRKLSNADDLVETLRQCQSPVKGVILADLCGIPRRTAQHWLKRLADQGVIECPNGPRSGWRLRRERMNNFALSPAHLC